MRLQGKRLFVGAFPGTGPGLKEDVSNGDTHKFSAAFTLAQAESLFIDVAEIFSVIVEGEVLAGIVI